MSTERDTVPGGLMPPSEPPDPDTGPISHSQRIKEQAALSLQDAFDQLCETQRMFEAARHMSDQALGMVADQEAQRKPSRLERIEAQLANVATKDDIAELKRLIVDLADSFLVDHQKVVSFERWKQEHQHKDLDKKVD